VRVPTGQGRTASRKRVLRGPRATVAAKRRQRACGLCDGAPKVKSVVEADAMLQAEGNTDAPKEGQCPKVWRGGSAGV